jgi:peptidoglycan/LPS O-acetylase OafA/YrhL
MADAVACKPHGIATDMQDIERIGSGANNYLPQIDGLRAIAVLAVLIHHWLSPAWPVGHWGVRLFFVISGYLITKAIVDLKTAGIGLWPAARRFFVRRTLRLFPAYYLAVVVGALFYADVREQWPWYIGYLTNILMAVEQRWIALTPTWSLAVEEQFYLAWFFAVMLAGARLRLVLLAAMVVAAPLVRLDAVAQGNEFLNLTLWAQFDALAAGALLFEAERRGWRLPVRWRPTLTFLSIGAAALLLALLHPALADFAGLLMLALPAWLAREGFDGMAGRVLSHPVVTQLGKISYGIYLYHMLTPALLEWLGSVLPGFWRVLAAGAWPAFVLRTAATLILAQLSYRHFEQPIRNSRLGRRLAFGAT